MAKLYIGREDTGSSFTIESDELVNHVLVLGATGSGKTVLCKAIIEELALSGYPVIAIDPKGDVGCLAMRSKNLDFRPWSDMEALSMGIEPEKYSEILRIKYVEELRRWNIDPKRAEHFHDSVNVVIYTPRSNYGVPLSIKPSLSPIPRTKDLMEKNPTIVLEALNSTASTILRLAGYSEKDLKEHTLLAEILRHAWLEGRRMTMEELIEEVLKPSFDSIGKLSVEEFIPQSMRSELARSLNVLISHPAYQAWLMGESIDFNKYFYEKGRISIIDLRFMNDLKERQLFLAIFLQELYKWILRGGGTSKLRFLLYIDEVMGFIPPVQNPPSKTLLMLLIKQGRAFGLGVMLATQNPADVDYRVLSNAAHRFIGRLSSKRDLENIKVGLGLEKKLLNMIPNLKPRYFIYHNYRENTTKITEVRWLLTYHRGPLKPEEIELLTMRFKTASKYNLRARRVDRRSYVEPVLAAKHILNLNDLSNFFKKYGYTVCKTKVEDVIYPAYRIKITYRLEIESEKINKTIERLVYLDNDGLREFNFDLVPVDILPPARSLNKDISISELQRAYTINAYFSKLVKKLVLGDELQEFKKELKKALEERTIYELNKMISEYKIKEKELRDKIVSIETKIRNLKREREKLRNCIKKLTKKRNKMRSKKLSTKKLSYEIRRIKMKYRKVEGELIANSEILKALKEDYKSLKKDIKSKYNHIKSRHKLIDSVVELRVVPFIDIVEKFKLLITTFKVELKGRDRKYEVVVNPHTGTVYYGRCSVCGNRVVEQGTDHVPPICEICGDPVCREHLFTCYKCEKLLCKRHAVKCSNIDAYSCPSHVVWRGILRKRAYCQ